MIPKVIHYCWFGRNEKPELAQKCIASWKKFCPEYEIKEWNENNYDYTKNKYMQEAYEAQKWGFVSDYARLDIIYQYGGFYFDTDVELIKGLDSLIGYKAFVGFEDGHYVANGLGFGAEAGCRILKEQRDYYDNLSFINGDGSYNLRPGPQYFTDVLLSKGLQQNNKMQEIEDLTILPMDYLNPKSFLTEELSLTDNSIAIHHAAMSWHSDETRAEVMKERRVYKKYGIWGWRIYHGVSVIRQEGLKTFFKKLKVFVEGD